MITPRILRMRSAFVVAVAALLVSKSAGAQDEPRDKCYVFFEGQARRNATEAWPWPAILSPVLEVPGAKLGGSYLCAGVHLKARTEFVEFAAARGHSVVNAAIGLYEVSDMDVEKVFEKHAAAVKAAKGRARPPIIISHMPGAVSQDCDALNAKLKAAGATILRPC